MWCTSVDSSIQLHNINSTHYLFTLNEGNVNSTETRMNDTVAVISSCSEGFYLEGVCQPECGSWRQFSDAAIIAVDFVIIFSIVVYLISAAVVIVLSLIRYKRV